MDEEQLRKEADKCLANIKDQVGPAMHNTDHWIARNFAELISYLSERADNSSKRFEKQMIELVGIAAEQKRLAVELDSMTKNLIHLTVCLVGLTLALVFLTFVLCLPEIRPRKTVPEVSFNPPQVTQHIKQTDQHAQKNQKPQLVIPALTNR